MTTKELLMVAAFGLLLILAVLHPAGAYDLTVKEDGVSLSSTPMNKTSVMKEVVTDLKAAPDKLAVKDADIKSDATYTEKTDFDILQWKTFSTTPVKTALKDIPAPEDRARYKAEYIAKYGNLAGNHTIVMGKDIVELYILDTAYLKDTGVLQLNISPKVNGVEKLLHNPLKIANPPVLVQGEPDVTVKDELILGGRAEDPTAATLESVASIVMRLEDGTPTFGEPDPTVMVYSAGNFTAEVSNTTPARSNSSETFLQHIVAAGNAAIGAGYNHSSIYILNASSTVFYTSRSTMLFNTNGLLPVGGAIQNASLNVYIKHKSDGYSAKPALSFTRYVPLNYTLPQMADFNRNLTGATRYGNDIPYNSVPSSGYVPVYFSSTGISQINNSGYTEVMGRFSNDTDSVAIPRGSVTTSSVFSYYTAFSDGTTKDPYIVYSYLRPAVADFSGSPLVGTPGLVVQFTSEVENATPISTYNWSFGDGYYSSQANPQHIYTTYGQFDVNLSITTSGGYSDYELKEAYVMISSEQGTQSWYSPHQVKFTIVDSKYNSVPDAPINASAIAATFPDGTEWLENLYGLDPSDADDMLNGTLLMEGMTGSDGGIVFTMLSSIAYTVKVQHPVTMEYQSVNISPIDRDYTIRLTGTAINNTYLDMGYNTTLNVTEPNSSYVTMHLFYEDMSARTFLVYFYVMFAGNQTLVYADAQNTTSMGVPGISTWMNYTVQNVRGEQYKWGYQAMRDA